MRARETARETVREREIPLINLVVLSMGLVVLCHVPVFLGDNAFTRGRFNKGRRTVELISEKIFF